MTAAYVVAALALACLAAWAVLRWFHRHPAVPFDTGLRVGVVAHVVDDRTVPLLRALGVTDVRVDRYAGGVNDASVARALDEGFRVVVVDMGGDYQHLAHDPWPVLVQRGNEIDAKGVAPEAAPLCVGISSAVTEEWLTAYVRRYRVDATVPLCIHAYGVPEANGLRNAVERAKRVLDATGRRDVLIWVTEFGVTQDRPVAELQAALAYLASEPRVQRAFVYALEDDAEHYGLVANGSGSGAFAVVQAFNQRTGVRS